LEQNRRGRPSTVVALTGDTRYATPHRSQVNSTLR